MRIVFLFLSLLCIFSVARAERPLVVASIFPLAEIAEEIGGDEIETKLLLPPGADPHSWEPTPKDILALKRARLLLAIGGGLEPWLEDILSGLRVGNLKILLFLSPPKHSHSHKIHHACHPENPHVWLDFLEDARFCLRVAETLAEIFPEKASHFRHRGKSLAEKFEALHERFDRTLKTCRHRIVPLAGHDAFSAWERNYGLDFVTLAGASPEAEPTPETLRKLIVLMRQEGLRAVFYDEPQSLRFAKIIARETGAKIYYLSPGANLTKEEYRRGLGFFDLMLRNLKNLSLGLECGCN